MNAVTELFAPAPGGALRFADVDGDAVRVAHDAALSPASFTVEAWIATTDADADFNRVVTKPVGGNQTYSLAVNDGEFKLLGNLNIGVIPGDFPSGGFVADGEPHHIAASYDGATGQITLYVDGQVTNVYQASNALVQGNEDLYIGDYPAPFNEAFDGDISEVRVWSDVRTPQEIETSFDQALAAGEPNLELYLTFDGDVLDQSGNGRDGTIDGAPEFVAGAAPTDAAVSAVEDQPAPVVGVTLGDADVGAVATVTLSVLVGELTLGDTTGLTFLGGANGSPSVTVQGLVADLNNALSTLTYLGFPDFNGDDDLSITVVDNGAVEVANASGAQSVPNDGFFFIYDFDTGASFAEARTGGVTEPNSAPENGVAILINPNNNEWVANAFIYTDGVLSFGDPANFTLAGYAGASSVNNNDLGPGQQFDDAVAGATLTYAQTDFPTPLGARDLTFTFDNIGFADAAPGIVTLTTADVTLGLSDTGLSQVEDVSGALNVPNAGFFFIYDFDTGVGSTEARTGGAASPTAAPENGVFIHLNPNNAEWGVQAVIIENGVETLGDLANFNLAGYAGTGQIVGDFRQFNDTTTNATLTFTETVPTPGGAREIVFTFEDLNFADNAGGAINIAASTILLDAEATTSSQISVAAVNDAPIINAPVDAFGDEDGSIPFIGLFIDDFDAGEGTGEVQLTLIVNNGVLAFGDTTGLTFDAGMNGEAGLTVIGQLFDVNAALSTLEYFPDPDFSGADNLDIFVDDLGNTGGPGPLTDIASVALFVAPTNDAPVITSPLDVTFGEDGGGRIDGISIDDIDAFEGGGQVELTLSVGAGVLVILDAVGLTFSNGANGGPSFTITGQLDDVNSGLTSLFYTPDPDFNGVDALTIDVSDLGNFGAPGPLFDNAMVDIFVNAENDAPLVEIDQPVLFAQEDAPLAITGIVIDDVDAAGGGMPPPVELSVSVFDGVLTFGDLNGLVITGGGNGSPSVTVQGNLGDIANALATLTYQGDDGFNGSDMLTVAVDDLGNTGAGGPLVANGSIEIDVAAVNDAPEIFAETIAFTGEEDEAIAITGLSVFDFDIGEGVGGEFAGEVVAQGGAELLVSLTVANGVLTLAEIGDAQIVAGANGSAMISILGAPGALNAALGGLSYQGAEGFSGEDVLTVTVDDLGNVGAPGPLTATTDIALNIAASDDVAVAQADKFSLSEDDVITGSLFADNGAGVDLDTGLGALTVVAIDGSAAPVGERILLASGAALTVEADGAFTYDARGAFDFLNVGDRAEDSFTYDIANLDGAADQATATFFIDGATELLNGTALRDVLIGADGEDHVTAGGGRDVISGKGGDDTVEAGAGDDFGRGGAGADMLMGEAGADRMFGEAGADSIWGGDDNDRLFGQRGEDMIFGNEGADRVTGGRDDDVLFGGRGQDTVIGGADDDRLHGNAGADVLRGGRGEDELFGGGGADRMRGGRGDDVMEGGAGADTMRGGKGDDTLIADGGRDVLVGGRGADVFEFDGAAGVNRIRDFNQGEDLIAFSGDVTFQDLEFEARGANVAIEFDATRVILIRQDADDLGVDDFIFG